MLLLRRLRPGRRPQALLLLQQRHASSPVALCSSWSPPPPPPPPPATATATADDEGGKQQQQQAAARQASPTATDPSFSYDLARARVIHVHSPFVYAKDPAAKPVKVVVVSNPVDARYWSERLAAALEADKGDEDDEDDAAAADAAAADAAAAAAAVEAATGGAAGVGEGGAAPVPVRAVVGLDLEWRPTFEAGIPERRAAVLQLAGPGMCLVVQLHKLNGRVPSTLRAILRDPRFLKVGVSINGDLAKLRRDWGLHTVGSHDLALAGGRILHGEMFRMCSLASIAAAVWGVELDKSKGVRLSNWEVPRLSDNQVRYAALDAIAGREIYLELRRRGQLPSEAGLEGMMRRWLGTGDEGDWRRARSLAIERDGLRRLYQAATGQSCFERDPPIVREVFPHAPPAAAMTAAAAAAGVSGLDAMAAAASAASAAPGEEAEKRRGGEGGKEGKGEADGGGADASLWESLTAGLAFWKK